MGNGESGLGNGKRRSSDRFQFAPASDPARPDDAVAGPAGITSLALRYTTKAWE